MELSNEEYFPVVLSIALCKAAPTFDSVKGLKVLFFLQEIKLTSNELRLVILLDKLI